MHRIFNCSGIQNASLMCLGVLQVLVHLGLLSAKSGFHIAELAEKGTNNRIVSLSK